ncbi:MAG: cytochrome c4 [Rhodocyclales bacterium]|nr:cytochrome c4 [Rhodocyclales bacterium]
MVKISCLIAVALAGASSISFAAGNPELGKQKAAACMACHGPDGNSPALPAPTEQWPKLAGQVPEYFAKQLHDFKAGKRSNAQMSPQAQNVAEADIANIAAYFATQKVAANEAGDKALVAQGEKIFHKGKGARAEFVAACAGCHGPKGAGQHDWAKTYSAAPVVLAPAIGGQHASYVVKQLKSFKDGSRTNEASNAMRDIAQRLSEGEIKAVAAYVASISR